MSHRSDCTWQTALGLALIAGCSMDRATATSSSGAASPACGDKSRPAVSMITAGPLHVREDAAGESASRRQSDMVDGSSGAWRDSGDERAAGDTVEHQRSATVPLLAGRAESGDRWAARPGGAYARQQPPAAWKHSETSSTRAVAEETQRLVFRPRPGRMLVGNVELRERADGVKVHVTIESVPPGVERLTLFRADNCRAFGAGAGRFNSWSLSEPVDELVRMGELSVPEGRGERDYTLPGASIHTEQGDLGALVLYAPVTAHDREVTEPIACARVPLS